MMLFFYFFAAPAFADPATLDSVTLAKSSLKADGADVQTVTITLNTGDPESITRAYATVQCNDPSTAIVMMRWIRGTGFQQEAGWGNGILLAGESATETQTGKFIIRFKFIAPPAVGNVSNSVVRYGVDQNNAVLIPETQLASTFNIALSASLESIGINKPILIANAIEAQTITVTVNADDPASITRSQVVVQCNQPSIAICMMFWEKNTGFRQEAGWGSGSMQVANCTTDIQPGRINITFKFTVPASIGDLSGNIVKTSVDQNGRMLVNDQAAPSTFDIHASTTLDSVTLAKSSLKADGADVQTVTITLNTGDPESITRADATVQCNDPSTAIVMMRWIRGTGFQQEAGWGNGILLAGESTTETQTGKFIIKFKFIAPPAVGNLANNVVKYGVEQNNAVLIPETQLASTFNIALSASLESIGINKPILIANASETQTITVTVNAEDPASITRSQVVVQCNQPSTAICMMFWEKNTGFRQEAGWGSGSMQVANCTTDIQPGRIIITFKFTVPASIGDLSGNIVKTSVDQNGRMLVNDQTASSTFNISIPTPPQVIINGSAVYTTSRIVTLTISVFNAGTDYSISYSFDNATWSESENYVPTKQVELPDGEAVKTVYVKYRNPTGTWSEPFSDTIVLDTTPPQLVITSPLDNAAIGPR